MRSLDRRTFLKGAAAVSASVAGSAFAAESPTPRDMVPEFAQQNTVWKKAPCRLCEVQCGLLIGIEGGRAVAVKGDQSSPAAQGLACAKGYYSVQAMYAGDRLRRAQIRKNGVLTEVPIGEALDLVAAKIRETIDKHGKNAVGIHGSSQWSLPDAHAAHKLFTTSLGTNHVSAGALSHTAAARAGLMTTFGLDGSVGSFDDIEHADTIVLWDINVAETDPVLFSRMLDRRRKNPGVRIVEVTTRTTRTSYAIDRSVLHAPRTSDAVARGIASEIVARDWVDRDFVDKHVAFKRGTKALGYGLTDDVAPADEAVASSYAEYVKSLATDSPEHVQEISGMSAANIKWLAALYGDRSRKVLSVWGANINQHARGTCTNNLLYNIHLLVGKMASPGNGAFALTGALGGVPTANAKTLATSAPLAIFRAFDRGDIRFMWVQGANPMASLPNSARYRRAAGRDDRFLVVSDVVPTATTKVADVVLPAAMWFEREGIDVNSERRLQHFELMTAPPGDAMSDAWQIIEVARRLGFSKSFPTDRRLHVEQLWDDYRAQHASAQTTLPSLATLRSTNGASWPAGSNGDTKWRYNTKYDVNASPANGGFHFYGHPDNRAWIWMRSADAPVEMPTREFPFWMNVGAVLEHSATGTLTQRIPTLHRAVPGAYAEFNAEDARQLRIRDHDTVRISNKRGAIEVGVRIDYRSQPPRGLIFVPSFDESVPVRSLMPDAFCPLSGQPDNVLCAVHVARTGSAGS